MGRFRLLEHEFNIQHRKEIKHKAADALSRLESIRQDKAEINCDIPGDLRIVSIAHKKQNAGPERYIR